MSRFLTLMRKMRARGYVEEELDLDGELLEEEEMVKQRCGASARIKKAIRLTFFASLPSSKRWDDPEELPDERLLGYAVVVNLELPNNRYHTYLMEAVVQPQAASFEIEEDGDSDTYIFKIPNYYIHNVRMFETCLGTKASSRKFNIEGNFFTQQNDLTSVCAHAALRMAVNSCPKIDLNKRIGSGKLTNKYINDVLGLDFTSPKRSVGHYEGDPEECRRGLTAQDIKRVVESFGMRLVTSNFVEESSVEYDEYLYPIVESHYPSILEVQGWDIMARTHYAHALAVMGHTLNSDRWEPEASYGYGNYPIRSYIPACRWVCHYVINDDNYGVSVTLPSDMIRNDVVPDKNPKLHATRVLSIVPKRIRVTGYRAQKVAMEIAAKLIREMQVGKKEYWLEKLRQKKHNLVCRTLLLEGKDYRAYIDEQIKDGIFEPTDAQYDYFKSVGKYVWVTEVTIPNLYTGNKTKLADVLVDAGATQEQVDSYGCVVLAWFPGFILARVATSPEYWYIKKHVPLIQTWSEAFIDW